MFSRRDILQVGAATAALLAAPGVGQAQSQPVLTEADLLLFDAIGTVTLVHVADLHGQLMPLHFRAWDIAMQRAGLPHALDEDLFYSLGGVPTRRVAEMLSAHYGLGVDAERIFAQLELAGDLVLKRRDLHFVVDLADVTQRGQHQLLKIWQCHRFQKLLEETNAQEILNATLPFTRISQSDYVTQIYNNTIGFLLIKYCLAF